MDWIQIITLIIFIFAFLALIFWIQRGFKKIKNIDNTFEETLKFKGIDFSSRINLGTYINGHPDLDDMITHVFSFTHENSLILYAKQYKNSANIETAYFACLAEIPFENITDITIEDNSSIEQKVTLGRVLLVGVFALAWKKDKKKQQAFVNIQWTDGKFQHQTLFRFDEKEAFQEANKVRNALIKQIR